MQRSRSRTAWTLWLTAAAWLSVVPAANAYIDAGSTTVIFQAVVAGLATAGMFLRVFWRRISGFFSRSSGDEATDTVPTVVPATPDADGDAGR